MKTPKYCNAALTVALLLHGAVAVESDAEMKEKAWPSNNYFRGVEDRIAQAEAIIVGRVQLIRKESIKGGRVNVKARIDVDSVLSGDNNLRVIEFSSEYFPAGYTFDARKRQFGCEDEIHARMMEVFPYGLKPSPRIIAFLKTENSKWHVFYAYFDDMAGRMSEAIRTIVRIEGISQQANKCAELVQIVEKDNPKILKEYAIRSLSKATLPWHDKRTLLNSMASLCARNEELYNYNFSCVSAHLEHGFIEKVVISEYLDLLLAMINDAPNSDSLSHAVETLEWVADEFRDWPEKVIKLHNIIIENRSRFGGSSNRAVLTKEDHILLQAVEKRSGTGIEEEESSH